MTTDVRNREISHLFTTSMNSTGSVSNIDFANPPSTARESTQDLASTVSQIFHKAATALSTVDHTLFETGLAEVVRNAATKLGSIFKEGCEGPPTNKSNTSASLYQQRLAWGKDEHGEGSNVENRIRTGSWDEEIDTANETRARAWDTVRPDSRKRQRAITDGSDEEDLNVSTT